jgi:hypothetical protein
MCTFEQIKSFYVGMMYMILEIMYVWFFLGIVEWVVVAFGINYFDFWPNSYQEMDFLPL